MYKVKKADITRHLENLCIKIGNRYSGSKGEKLGTEYIASQMKNLGLNTKIIPFKFLNWIPRRIKATIIKNEKETRIPNIGPFTYSPSTEKSGLQGDIVYIESTHPAVFKNEILKGKIGLSIGAHDLGNPELASRIMDSGLAGMMTVDERIPFPWRVPIGMAPQWSKDYTLPTVAVPYLEAIKIEKMLPARARLEVKASTKKDQSWNVLGEIRGSKYPDEVIIISSHTDSVLYNVGADDNASGCAFILELARYLKNIDPVRTIRFISYGVEEKLSVGAYMYMRSLPKSETEKIVFCLNADSIGSRIGQNVVLCTGTDEMSDYFQEKFDSIDYAVSIREGVDPFSDHFPLNIWEIPSVWITRLNLFNAGYWALHSQHDNLENLSLEVCANTISAFANILSDLCTREKMPFPRKISPKFLKEVRKIAKLTYRHPWDPEL